MGLLPDYPIEIHSSEEEQWFLSLSLVQKLGLRGEEGPAGPREAQAHREGPQWWQENDRTGNKTNNVAYQLNRKI